MVTPPLTMGAWLRWDLIRQHLQALSTCDRVLEIGMGQGAVGARLAQGRSYTGVEPDDESRAVARERLPAAARVAVDLDQLQPDERFSLVCAFEVVEHIEDDVAAVQKWAAHLDEGGTLMLSVPAYQHRFSSTDRLVGHYRRYSREQLTELVEGAGLEVVSVEATGFPLGFVLEWARNVIAARQEVRTTRAVDHDAPASTVVATGSGSRWLQPPDWLGIGTRVLTWPFRLAQRPFTRTGIATGWLLRARKPVS